MKIKWKPLIFFIVITLAIAGIGGFLGGSTDNFNNLTKPSIAPPAILFPIVWNILYILMGISAYLVYINAKDKDMKIKALTIYFIQLVVNALWTLLFFKLNMLLFSFWWIILIIILVVIMLVVFYKIKPLAAYINIPYLLWLIFASVLNYSFYLLNS